MKIKFKYILFILLPIFFSCEKRHDIINTDSSVKLEFLNDTISFDTLFTTFPSITKRLKIYNPINESIKISRISLKQNLSGVSYYLAINGEESNNANDILLLKKDSLLILINLTIAEKDQDQPFMIKNEIIFETNGNEQTIPIIAWGQDSYKIQNKLINCNTVWTSGRPYILYDTNLVNINCKLTIEKGTRIHLAPKGILWVAGTFSVLGDTADQVIIQGLRTDKNFSKQPGQWNMIRFLPDSKNNVISGAVIKNGTVGLLLGTPDEDTEPDLTISNTIIENMSRSGIESYTSDLVLTNVLIQNCLNQTLGCWAGGNYHFVHCTFDNSCSAFFHMDPSVVISNMFQTQNVQGDIVTFEDDINVEMYNCIIWGTLENELLLINRGNFGFKFSNGYNIIKTFDQTFNINNNLLNEDPLFLSCKESSFMLEISSPAIDQGKQLGIIKDILGNERDEKPDIGAYKYVK